MMWCCPSLGTVLLLRRMIDYSPMNIKVEPFLSIGRAAVELHRTKRLVRERSDTQDVWPKLHGPAVVRYCIRRKVMGEDLITATIRKIVDAGSLAGAAMLVW